MVSITNKTRKTNIVKNARLCENFVLRALGLMLRKKSSAILIAADEGIKQSTIHMFFMRFSLDLIWLNSQKKVVSIYKDAKPFSFRVFKPEKPAKYIVEVPFGTAEKSKTKVGDKIEFKE